MFFFINLVRRWLGCNPLCVYIKSCDSVLSCPSPDPSLESQLLLEQSPITNNFQTPKRFHAAQSATRQVESFTQLFVSCSLYNLIFASFIDLPSSLWKGKLIILVYDGIFFIVNFYSKSQALSSHKRVSWLVQCKVMCRLGGYDGAIPQTHTCLGSSQNIVIRFLLYFCVKKFRVKKIRTDQIERKYFTAMYKT